MEYNEIIYKYICHLYDREGKSMRQFALDHNIDEGTIRDIRAGRNYQISLPTIYKICEARAIKLSTFFAQVEKHSNS